MNPEHLKILRQGVKHWNFWRDQHPEVRPDLEGANVQKLTLRDVNLSNGNLRRLQAGGDYKSNGANFLGANFTGADLEGAQLRSSILRHAKFDSAILTEAKLTNADLYHVSFVNCMMHKVDLWGSAVTQSDFRGADLTEARLRGTMLIRCDFRGSILSGSVVYGCSAWDLQLTNSTQDNLIITPDSERQKWRGSSASDSLQHPTITVDNLEVSQFLYLVLNNSQIRDAIETIGKKAVLILGRFTPERKAILDVLRCELRNHNQLPIMFDFQKPSSRNFTETVSLLAHMSRFIIADITDAKAIPQELQRIVPSNPSVPVAPILESDSKEFGMFIDFADFPWVLPIHKYDNKESLVASLGTAVIDPCISRAQETEERRRRAELAT